MKKELRLLPSILFLLILLIFFYLLTTDRKPHEIPSSLINKKVPLFETESLLKKEKFNSNIEFGNEIILVNFFATWCKPCRDEHVFITKFSDKKKIRVIGINYKDDPIKTINWLNKFGNPYSNIPLDKNGRIAIEWGVYGIPETFVVDSNGIIKYRLAGPITNETFKKINLVIEESN